MAGYIKALNRYLGIYHCLWRESSASYIIIEQLANTRKSALLRKRYVCTKVAPLKLASLIMLLKIVVVVPRLVSRVAAVVIADVRALVGS